MVLIIAFAASLMVIGIGLILLSRADQQNPGRFFKAVAYGLAVAGFILFLATCVGGFCRLFEGGGYCYGKQECRPHNGHMYHKGHHGGSHQCPAMRKYDHYYPKKGYHHKGSEKSMMKSHHKKMQEKTQGDTATGQ